MPPCTCCGPLGPKNCKTHHLCKHRCSCADTEDSVINCKSNEHNCMCKHGNGCRREDHHCCSCKEITPISCLCYSHYCTCVSSVENCRSDKCICTCKINPDKCKANFEHQESTHDCVCETNDPKKCKYQYGDHKCVCLDASKKCRNKASYHASNFHVCVCLQRGPSFCKTKSYMHVCTKDNLRFAIPNPDKGGLCIECKKCNRFHECDVPKDVIKACLHADVRAFIASMVHTVVDDNVGNDDNDDDDDDDD